MRRSLILLVLLAACSIERKTPPPADRSADREALMAADRAFADSTAAHGLDGWMQFYAADAVRLELGGEATQGLEGIRAKDSLIFVDPSRLLTWQPVSSGVFADGQHGFTTGRWARVRLDSTRDTLGTGRYVTMWRRGSDGHWRVILDTGSGD